MQGYEAVIVNREVHAVLIPDGMEIVLQPGTEAIIFQALGECFTVNISGNLARIAGKDADALGKTVVEAEPLQPAAHVPDDQVDVDLIWQQLKSCYDPEIPVDIVELGLIYAVDVTALEHDAGYKATIKMTLTAPACGMGDILVADVEHRVQQVPNVRQVDVELLFDPPWDRSMMSEQAKLLLGM